MLKKRRDSKSRSVFLFVMALVFTSIQNHAAAQHAQISLITDEQPGEAVTLGLIK